MQTSVLLSLMSQAFRMKANQVELTKAAWCSCLPLPLSHCGQWGKWIWIDFEEALTFF